MKVILGEKVAMSQIWRDETVIPVTLIRVDGNAVAGTRTAARDGYDAIRIRRGRTIREFRVSAEDAEALSAPDAVGIAQFAEGDIVRISAISKGKGFQGVVKRHGFGGGPKSHGQKDRHRAPGSIGSTAAQRVFKGKRMAGRMGGTAVTIKKAKIMNVQPDKHIVMVKGQIPGRRGTLVKLSVA